MTTMLRCKIALLRALIADRRMVRPAVLAVFIIRLASGVGAADDDSAEVRYSRDIRPILAANCFGCHGADDKHREADLRLDTFEGASSSHDGRAAIVPGQPDQSELLKRVLSHDPDLTMPPPDSGKSLSSDQIQLLQRWIKAGATYEQHWSFAPPQRPEVPDVGGDWARNPIDHFIAQRLQKEELQPSEQAQADVLLRRMHLDLIGLPPTESQITAFRSRLTQGDTLAKVLSDVSEQLLASPHFGEKWARHWLDAARYADSDGFEKDKPRFVWFYRDWVVNAFNKDMPYDQFLLEQLAGDMLPNRTQDQLVATGFLRNSMINEEGGVDPEQFRMEAMFDRMDAIGKAMLGLTIQCSQCHNHKYDPLSQQEYYQFFANFNNCDEAQATVYTTAEQDTIRDLRSKLSSLRDKQRSQVPDWKSQLSAWAKQLPATSEWVTVRPELDTSGGQKHYLLEDGSILAAGYAPTQHTTTFTANVDVKDLAGFRIELLNDPNLPHNGPGRSIYGLCALSEMEVFVEPLDKSSGRTKVKLVSVTADVEPPEAELEKIFDNKSGKRRVTGPSKYSIDGDNTTAWGIDIGGGRSNVPRQAVYLPESPMHCDAGFRVTFNLAQMHGGWNSDDNQNNNLGRFRLSVTSQPSQTADQISSRVRSLASRQIDELTTSELDELFDAWRTTRSELTDTNAEMESLWKQHPRGYSQLVLLERAKVRPTYFLTRGDFLKPEDVVQPGVAALLNSGSGLRPRNRLDVARWIARRDSPTTARAIVNRIWQEYFGVGIVRTAEDLGTQGEYPMHPELLDWLAVELMDNNWSLKHIHRLIVNSSTYQQSSKVSPQLYEKDPENRLLARGPRVRVSGEIVRDIFLAASGLLNDKVGGPGVYPPSPKFLYEPPASYGPKTWNLEQGNDRYRRALYTFRFRSVPYPALLNFDAPRGDTACVRRSRSNTPLQALTTLNEDLFMDCSRALGLVAVQTRDLSVEDRIRSMFRRCVTREATPAEVARLATFLNEQEEQFSSRTDEELRQFACIDPSKPPELPAGMAMTRLAAFVATARVILNLDEVIVKE